MKPLILVRPSVVRTRRGVSLIEALVALAVMAFGMLGVIGIQTTLRANADIAKQRSEAVRIAQEQLETWRVFSVLSATPGHTRLYSDIADVAPTSVVGYTTNTTYQLSGTVVESAPAGSKTLVVDVQWTDRTGATQNVRLSSAVAGIAPELAATLVTPATGAPTRRPYGRHRGIPPAARDFGNGTSGYIPPQPLGVSIGWLFNNTTGLFTICTTTVSGNPALAASTDLTGCGTQPHLLLAGYVRYATTAVQPTASDVADANANGPVFTPRPEIALDQTAPVALTGTRACFVAQHGGATFREYDCAVPVAPASPTWGGSLHFVDPLPPLATSAGDVSATRFRICRYFPGATYVGVKEPLLNQNFVVILAGDGGTPFTCPAGVTWTHQP